MAPFHLAFPVLDLEATRSFYVETIGASVGREAERWIDFNLDGHQLSAHLVSSLPERLATNPVDGEDVPAFHFGVVLPWKRWHAMAERLQKRGTKFLIEPTVRFEGEVGEQATFFILDPSGHALEFKSFQGPTQLFAR